MVMEAENVKCHKVIFILGLEVNNHIYLLLRFGNNFTVDVLWEQKIRYTKMLLASSDFG